MQSGIFKKGAVLFLIVSCSSSLAFGGENDDDSKSLKTQASQLALQTRYYAEQERIQLQKDFDENIEEPRHVYERALQELLSLPTEARSRVIDRMVADLRASVLVETGEGAHRSSPLLEDGEAHQRIEAFAELLAHLHNRVPDTSEEFEQKMKLKTRSSRKKMGAGLLLMLSSPLIGPSYAVFAVFSMFAGAGTFMWGGNGREAVNNERWDRAALLPLFQEFLEKITSDAVLMDALHKRAALEAGEGQKESEKLLGFIADCNRLLAPPKNGT